MDNKISTYSPAFSIVSWIALVGGIVTYLLGLWNAEMQLNEKGYYFAVLVLGLFSAASYQKTVRDKYEGIPTTSIYYMTCLTVFIISVALLMVGLWNATLLLSEKGFYGLAFFLSLFGAVAVQKNIRDAGINPPKETHQKKHRLPRKNTANNSRKPGQSNVTGLLLNSLICFCRFVVPA
ncbi:YiaB family inner membrane protein [Shigella flexneri]|nr:YiaB family inner membrane protein [Escherichia coli]MBB8555307.1 YiaB family inner membrane protein [Escherichia coli]ULI55439.1 YiaB family inner membrane protein [Shigella flexneri]